MSDHAQVSAASRPSRRTVVRTAAWTVPAVSAAAAAPAYAASCDRQTYSMNWSESNFSRASLRSATGTAYGNQTGNRPVIITMTSVSYSNNAVNNDITTSNNRPDASRNLNLPPQTDGADPDLDPGVTSLGGRAGERGIRLQHSRSDAGRGNRQELTLSFSRPVQSLTFFVTDIDRIGVTQNGVLYGYEDRVEISSSPAIALAQRTQTPDGVLGNGIQGDPWYRTANENRDENLAGAQVKVQFPATNLNSVTLTYWNNAGTGIYHRVFLGNLSFSAMGC
jgi:hypothetical protein